MSWLCISGKRFLCVNCEWTILVEFDGGALMTQIGDHNILAQVEQYKKLDMQPNPDPMKNGFYLYDRTLCPNCYAEYKRNNALFVEENEKLLEIINELSQQKDVELKSIKSDVDFDRTIDKLINEISIREIDNIIGFSSLSSLDKHQTVLKNIKHLKKIIKEKRGLIDEKFAKYCLDSCMIHERVKQFNKLVAGDDLLSKYQGKRIIFIPKQIKQPENLNNYVQTDYTVRTPKSDTPSMSVYYKYEIELQEIRYRLQIQKDDYEDIFSVNDKSINLLCDKYIHAYQAGAN